MRDSANIAVIGAGVAGISAAVSLTDLGHSVTLFESSPKLGGRAFSFSYPLFDLPLDNGQHILMGCYSETLKLLKHFGKDSAFADQKQLSVTFADQSGNFHSFTAGSVPYPFDLLQGILKTSLFTRSEKKHLLSFFAKLPFMRSVPAHSDVQSLLRHSGMDAGSLGKFWELLGISACNSELCDIDPDLFLFMLRQIFLHGKNASRLLIPAEPLSRLFAEPAFSFLTAAGQQIRLSERVTALHWVDNNSLLLDTQKENNIPFDAAVFAVPPYALSKIAGAEAISPMAAQFRYSSILTFHFHFKNQQLKAPMIGLLGSPVHWVFPSGNRITTVTSAANRYIDQQPDSLFEMAVTELEKYLHLKREDIIGHKMIIEKRATFIPDAASSKSRPLNSTEYPNIFLAGDYTDTKLPATIEGAIRSGINAAKLCNEQ